MSKEIKIYTDGSSLGNPGQGGWGVVVITNYELRITNEKISSKKQVVSSKEGVRSKKDITEKETIIKELGGFDKNTTNNRMELQGAIEALKYIDNIWKSELEDIVKSGLTMFTIFTDSNYVLSGITSWIYNWEKNGWRTANKKEVLNQDLWKELIGLIRNINIKIKWEKVKGHSGHIYNDKADEIATSCALKQRSR